MKIYYKETNFHKRNKNILFDIAIEIFRKESKNIAKCCKSGIHIWGNENWSTYALTIYCFRIMIYKYHKCPIYDCH